jgi:FkbM family methyltransferase
MRPKADTRQPVLARLLRWYLRSNLRGRTRLTSILTRHLPPLWSVPIRIRDCAPLYVDLRSPYAQYLLKGEPWDDAPREQAEQHAMRRVVRRGEVVIDIGANLGIHTVLLAKLVGPGGKLFVFEPNIALLPALRRTIAGLPNASLHSCALSDEPGPCAFFIPEDDTKASFVNWTDEAIDGHPREDTCERRRLDEMVAEGMIANPDFIKCDVEGAELLVFRGARAVLDRVDAPIILFEVNAYTAQGFGFAVTDAKEFLESLPSARYRFFEIRDDGALPRVVTLAPFCNLLAIPEAKLSRFRDLSAEVERAESRLSD